MSVLAAGEEFASGSSPARVGLRARAKLRRRNAIRESARHVFEQYGYGDATTREIASRAEVSPGTLFAYARTKSELMFMILNDDLDQITARQLPLKDKPLLDALLEFYAPRYQYWRALGRVGTAARLQVAALNMGRVSMGPEASRFVHRDEKIRETLDFQLASRQAIGLMDANTDTQLVAQVIWSIYQVEIERWLKEPASTQPEALAELRRLFLILLRGAGVHRKELGTL